MTSNRRANFAVGAHLSPLEMVFQVAAGGQPEPREQLVRSHRGFRVPGVLESSGQQLQLEQRHPRV